MNSIKNLRQRLGLTQEYLAILLGVTRSLVAMAEAGKRELPPDASQKLLVMLTIIGKPGKMPSESPAAKLPAQPANSFEELYHWAQDKSESLGLIARKMEKNYAIAMQRQKYFGLLFPKPAAKERIIIELLEMENEAIINQCNPDLQKWCRQLSAHLQKIPGNPKKISKNT